MFDECYRGKRVLLTGHDSFKGSWMSLWLKTIGAHVMGLSLGPPTQPNHYDLLGLNLSSTRADLRDRTKVRDALLAARPDIVFHMAAQSSVLESYRSPLETLSVNAIGTAHVLDAARESPGLRAVVVVTTDKCYENNEWVWGYRETDALGGHDPYSASKAMAELVASSYRRSYFSRNENNSSQSVLIASVRSGNIVGGGDWKEDRIVPDVVRAVSSGRRVLIRNPGSTRPWQHVLEPVCGYLMLGRRLLEGDRKCADAWNFGPPEDGAHTVLDMVEELRRHWPQIDYEIANAAQTPHEATLLKLDCSKARALLGWRPVWGFADLAKHTAEWYRRYAAEGVVDSARQLALFRAAAAAHLSP